MKKGVFITVEGPDGSGKSTQLEYIKEYMRSNGVDALFTREPGGTPISEKIRTIILDPENKELAPMTEALLYAASRAQHIAQFIKPALERGKVVVCDRFVDSSLKIEPEIAMERLNGPSDRLESETMDFHRAVYRGYLELEKKFPERIVAVDATLPAEEVRIRIEEHITDLLYDHYRSIEEQR